MPKDFVKAPETARPVTISLDEIGVSTVLDFRKLEERYDGLRLQYSLAQPFKHVVIDEFFAHEAAVAAAGAFPPFEKPALARILGARVYSGKLRSPVPPLQQLFDALHDDRFTRWLEAVTGVPDLMPDPRLVGGGIHQGARGSDLPLHADHNTHPDDARRYRRINVLVYLNPNWQASWDGDLQLWDAQAAGCTRRIEPAFNRCVVMQVHDHAYHGYDRLRIPSGEARQSIATYFYSSVPDAAQAAEPHGTLFPRLRGGSVLERIERFARRKLLHRVEKTARTFTFLRR